MGIRELKNRLSEYLRRVAQGERVTVTDRGRPIAIISPPVTTSDAEEMTKMVREGLARWEGGKPGVPKRPVKIRGKPISDSVLEDRR